MPRDRKPPAGGSYEVGYGRPPKATQFRKGRSGNPKGRPRKALNLATIARTVLSERMTVMDGGRRRSMTKFEAAIHANLIKAMKGDARSFANIMAMTGRAGLFGAEPPPSDDYAAPAEDAAIYAQFFEAMRAELAGSDPRGFDAAGEGDADEAKQPI